MRVDAKLAEVDKCVETANDPATGSDAVARVWREYAAANRE
jgi:hypothetical protein